MRSSFQVTRRAHLNRYIEFLDQIGAPVEQGVQSAKLPVEAVAPDTIVTVQAVWNFVDFMSRRTGIDALGLEVGVEAQEKALSGALRAGIESAPTLLDGIHLFCRLARTESSDIAIGVAERPDSILFWHHGALDGHPALSEMELYSLQVLLGVVRVYTGPLWQPPVIALQSPRVPPRAREMFPETRFVSGRSAHFIRIPRPLLSTPPRRSATTPVRADSRVVPLPTGFAPSLRRLLEAYIPDGSPTVELAAAVAGISSRTLQRRLQAVHVSFTQLLDQVRYEMATRLLGDPSIKVIVVAHETGYEDPSHFARAFRRLAGVSPRQYRRYATREAV